MNLADNISCKSSELEALAKKHSEFCVWEARDPMSVFSEIVLQHIRLNFSDDYKNNQELFADIADFYLFQRQDHPYLHRVMSVALISKPGFFVLLKDDASMTTCKKEYLESELLMHLRIYDFNHTE